MLRKTKGRPIEAKVNPHIPGEVDTSYIVKWRPEYKGWYPLNYVWRTVRETFMMSLSYIDHRFPLLFENFNEARKFAEKIKEDPSFIDRYVDEQDEKYDRAIQKRDKEIKKRNRSVKL